MRTVGLQTEAQAKALGDMKKDELQAEAAKRGLSTEGNKSDILAAIEEYDKAQSDGAGA